eukprot:Skav204256  [mRNA]  locus=scaffold912:142967:146616:- [translate_table: standard]
MLGLACGLLLGVLHLPEAGVVRDFARPLKIVACTVLGIFTLWAATYPWHMIPSFGEHHRPVSKRWIMMSSLLVIALIYIMCILKEHPPSTYAHDAKWCIFGIWLSTMAYQFFEASKAWSSTMWSDFALAFAISVDSVVLGWVVIMFQSRIRVLRPTGRVNSSRFWIYVMCTAFIMNSVCTAIQRGFSDDVQWAAKVLRMELVICATLGVTTFMVWSTINVVKVIQLMDPDESGWITALNLAFLFFEDLIDLPYKPQKVGLLARDLKATKEYDRIKMKVWFYVSILRRFDGVLNAFELALLSGILWQGTPPEEHDVEMESRSRLRGLTSMSDFLEVESEQEVYKAKVEELAHRGFTLKSLMKFWDELLEGELMPSFDPRRSQTNDVVRQAIIPSSRVGHGGVALARILGCCSQGLFSQWVDGKERSRQVGRIWRRSSCSSRVFEDGDSNKEAGTAACSCCHLRSMFSPFRSEAGEDSDEASDTSSSS